MLCFLPPVPALRRDPPPEPRPHQPARAAQAVILILVVLNVLFVLLGLLPLVVRMERHDSTERPDLHASNVCAERRSVGLPETLACHDPSASMH